jgi:osmotically-inducible protein OsmY
MAQSGGRYGRDEQDDRQSGWRRDRDYESGQRYGRGQSEDEGEYGYRSSSRGDWQNQGSQGGEWNRMGRYGEDNGNQGFSYRDREEGMNRGYGRQQYDTGDYARPSYGDSSAWGPGGRSGYGGYGGGYGSSSSYGAGYGGYGGGQSSQRNDRGFMDKAGDEVASWFGDDEARRRRQQDEHRGRGPKGYARSDERIKEDVSDKLTDDGSLDASDIEVQVSNREVTLTGEVNSREDKRRAEDIAELISGVQHVQNNLRIKNRSGAMMDTARQAGSCAGRR